MKRLSLLIIFLSCAGQLLAQPLPKETAEGVVFVDLKEALVFTNRFDEARQFRNGYAAVRHGQAWSCIDLNGQLITGFEFQSLGEFYNDLAPALKGKWGVVNKHGEWVIKPQYYEMTPFSDDVVVAKAADGYVLCRSDGVEVSKNIRSFRPIAEGLIPYQKTDRWGYLNVSGQVAITERFDDAFSFCKGVGRVKMSGKWGFVNRIGDYLVVPRFDFLGELHEGLAAAKLDDKWGWVSSHGVFMIQPEFGHSGTFSEGLAPALKGGKYGYVDQQGKIVIRFQFEDANEFHEGLAVVQKANGYVYIDHKGDDAFGKIFVAALPFQNGVARIALDNWMAPKWRLLTRDGRIF